MSLSKGLVSIIMPAYNASSYILDSINSVVKQSYENWELIIVNDHSSDNTSAVISSVHDNRITLIENKKNIGVALSRNVAISKARGQFLAFLDSDDIWYREKLELQLLALKKNPNAVCSHSSYNRIDSEGKYISKVSALNKVELKTMLRGNFIGNLTGLIDRDGLDINIEQKNVKHEDYLMWLEVLMSKDGTFSVGVMECCAEYRVLNGSISSNKLKSMKWHWNILRTHLKMSVLTSAINLLYYLYYAFRKRA